jgi:hypothetical protein
MKEKPEKAKQVKLESLPKSDDEFWDGEVHREKRISYPICKSHKRYVEHEGYKDNGDGTVSCLICNWGFIKPGYIRILNGKVYDMRKK